MGKFSGIYLVSDLDGTLLDNRTYKISCENIEAIKYFMAEGGFFGFATGRIISELRPLDDLIKTNAPSIACNGTKIYDFTTEKGFMIDSASEDILPFLGYVEDNFPDMMIEIVSDDTIYYYRPNSSLKKHQSITNAEILPISHYSLIPHPWVKIAIWNEPDKIRDFANRSDKSLIPPRYNFMYSFEYCCEISTHSASKGTALLKAAETIPNVSTIAAIGDNENDITMLKNADIAFAPANAILQVKEAADIILSADCNHHAVAAAIQELEKSPGK